MSTTARSEGTVSIVTGGGGGLGSAIAGLLIAKGDTVYVADYDLAAATTVTDQLKADSPVGTAIPVQIDVSSDERNRALVERVRGEHGRLDVATRDVVHAARRLIGG